MYSICTVNTLFLINNVVNSKMSGNSFDDLFDSCDEDSVAFLNGVTKDNFEAYSCVLSFQRHIPNENTEDHSTWKLNNFSSDEEFENTERTKNKGTGPKG